MADAGIREATILGQGIGMAMRGLRPIAEIQYLDYLLYAIQIMSDDLATLQYRTKGRQKSSGNCQNSRTSFRRDFGHSGFTDGNDSECHSRNPRVGS